MILEGHYHARDPPALAEEQSEAYKRSEVLSKLSLSLSLSIYIYVLEAGGDGPPPPGTWSEHSTGGQNH